MRAPNAPLEWASSTLDPALLEGPDDFDDFWLGVRAEAMDVSAEVERLAVVSRESDLVTTQVRYRSTGGRWIGGWLREPAGVVARSGIVRLTGYGGLAGPHEMDPPLGLADCAEFFPVLRGLGALSLDAEIPAPAGAHVLYGIGHRETYVHRACVQDAWLAVSALEGLVPHLEGVDLWGGSFGGGIGVMALPWEPRVRRACFVVPSFGDHPRRIETPCEGSGEAVRMAVAQYPSLMNVLAYFDAATAAVRVRVPVMVAIGRVDPAVPPVGQAAIYEALGGVKSLLVQSAGHLDHPFREQENAVRDAAFAAWLAD